MKNSAWLVRPYPHGIKRVEEFTKGSFVAVGWPCIGDLSGKTREQIKTVLSGSPYNLSGLELGNAYATIDIIVNQMSIGDLVLMPDGDDIFFAKITSEYYLDSNSDNTTDGFSHRRNVKFLEHTMRKNLSNELRSSLKVHRTTADLTRHYNEIEVLSTGGEAFQNRKIELLEVKYPLRSDFNLSFKIPHDITKDEAERLAKYFSTLYFFEEGE